MKIFLLALLVTAACGVPLAQNRKDRNRNGRIVGGQPAILGQLPYQISFRDTSGTQSVHLDFHFCGGSIYNEVTILDAGHCVNGEDYENPIKLQIVAGQILNSDNSGQRRDVTQITLHPNYQPQIVNNDVSLLKLDSALTFDANVAPIGIADVDDTYVVGEPFIVSGWGTLAYGGETPDELMYVEVPFVDEQECENEYSAITVTPAMICAGSLEHDSCQGDSGGPMVKDVDGTMVQVGIVSWGIGCGDGTHVGVYTKCQYFKQWIIDNAF